MYEYLANASLFEIRRFVSLYWAPYKRYYLIFFSFVSLILAITYFVQGVFLSALVNLAGSAAYYVYENCGFKYERRCVLSMHVTFSLQAITTTLGLARSPSLLLVILCVENVIAAVLKENLWEKALTACTELVLCHTFSIIDNLPTDHLFAYFIANIVWSCCITLPDEPVLPQKNFLTIEQIRELLNEIPSGIGICGQKEVIVSNKLFAEALSPHDLENLVHESTKLNKSTWKPLRGPQESPKKALIGFEYKLCGLSGCKGFTVILLREISKKRLEIESMQRAKHKMMLLMSLSHEFRNPVNGLLTMLPLLKERLSDPQDQYHVDAILTCAKTLNIHINNCLDYLSIEGNEFELKKKPFNLGLFLQNALSLIMMQANRKGLIIDLQKSEGLPEFLNTDESRLQQVIINLLKNAVKYTHEGTVTLRITKDPNESQMIIFQVSDTGIGIPLEKRVQLFKLFGGGPDTLACSNNPKRTGFGLTIANMLCKYLGKELLVESEEGKGTTFTFWVKADNEKSPPKFKILTGDKSKSFRNLNTFNSKSRLIRKKTSIEEEKKPQPISHEQSPDINNTSEFENKGEVKEVIKSRPKKFLSFIDNPLKMLTKEPIRKSQRKIDLVGVVRGLNERRPPRPRLKREKTVKASVLDTPKLLARRLNGTSQLCSPHAKGSAEFEDIVTSSDRSKQITAVSFVPGKNLALNQEFLADYVGSQRRDAASKSKRVYHNAMVHLNHSCNCPIVLIVDDNEINKIALSGMLQRFGLKFREGGNGVEALTVLKKENAKNCCKGIRLVLMDCDMPVMDGLTASREISTLVSKGKISQPTVVAVTAYHGTSIEKECLESGMKEYMSKPVDIDKLFDCIQRHLAN